MGLLKSGGFWFLLFILLLAFNAFTFMRTDSFDAIGGLFSEFSGFAGEQKPLAVNEMQVFFCPEDNCSVQLIEKIDSAQKSIYVAIYSFTLDELSDALIRAKARGVDVKVVFDYGQSQNDYSDDEKLAAAGISIARRNGAGYMHNKFAVIDGALVATGSFNYSSNADEKNDENLIFISSPELAAQYKTEFDELWASAS